MEQTLKESLLTVCQLLEKHNVNYLIVGGIAVALNGYYRHSTNLAGELTEKPDIDIWYNPTYENYFNLLKVLVDLGTDVTSFKGEQNPNPKTSFFRLDFYHFTFDALPSIKADLKFTEANQRKETVKIDEVSILFMSFDDLIKDKEVTARKKDLEDIDQLKKSREK